MISSPPAISITFSSHSYIPTTTPGTIVLSLLIHSATYWPLCFLISILRKWSAHLSSVARSLLPLDSILTVLSVFCLVIFYALIFPILVWLSLSSPRAFSCTTISNALVLVFPLLFWIFSIAMLECAPMSEASLCFSTLAATRQWLRTSGGFSNKNHLFYLLAQPS